MEEVSNDPSTVYADIEGWSQYKNIKEKIMAKEGLMGI